MSVNVPPIQLLMVDDQPEQPEPLQQWLEQEKYSVYFEKDSTQVATTIQRLSPALILINGDIANRRGLEVCEQVKANELLGFIPVIALLTESTEMLNAAFDAGADDVLLHPIKATEMLTRIRMLLRVKAHYDSLWLQNKTLTAELAKQTAQLEHAMHESRGLAVLRDSIVNNVSHELQTPLLQVKSSVAMLAEDARAASPNGVSVLADYATAATARLESIVRNIAQLAASMNLKLQPFHIEEATDLAIRQLGRQWSSSGGVERVQIQSLHDIPIVLGDRGGVAQVLQQLLDNAIKFSPKGGAIKVWAETCEGKICVYVRDQGIGISSDQVDRIFQAFYQVDSSTTRPFSGTGVGLAIVKLLLDAMGSKIQVQSKLGNGSTFSFDLSIAKLENLG